VSALAVNRRVFQCGATCLVPLSEGFGSGMQGHCAPIQSNRIAVVRQLLDVVHHATNVLLE
jgi:hypothetical protein